MTSAFRLGFMTHLEGSGDPGKIYKETLELLVAADQLGFDVAWVAQHHFKYQAGRLPSPLPFLAAASQQTRNIRLGTALVVVPLEDPLRLAEDAAVVDVLSGGRLELGVGSGGDPDEFDAFDRPLHTRHAHTSAGVELLRSAFRGDALGRRSQRLQPPAPTLIDRLWQSAASADGARYVADNGAGLLLARVAFDRGQATDIIQAPVVKAYREAWLHRGKPPRIGLSRAIYPAADRRTALTALRTGVLNNVGELIAQGQLAAGQSLEAYCAQLNIAYGHPEEIVTALAADRVLPEATDLILQFNPGVPSLDEALGMLEQVVTLVAPQLGWRPHRALGASKAVTGPPAVISA